MSAASVKEQLLYEIHDPRASRTPDVVADFGEADVRELGPDEVMLSGVRGHPRTDTSKANVFFDNGWLGEAEISNAGPNARAYAGMMPKLDEHELALHGSESEWGLIPASRLGTKLRKIQNRRFMVCSAYSYDSAQPQHVVDAMLADCYKRCYRDLKSHRLEYVRGVTALTRDGSVFFGEAAKGLYAPVGCNGNGACVLNGTNYGKFLAEMVLGGQSQELSDVLSMESPSWLPPEPLRGMAELTAIHLQKKKAGAER